MISKLYFNPIPIQNDLGQDLDSSTTQPTHLRSFQHIISSSISLDLLTLHLNLWHIVISFGISPDLSACRLSHDIRSFGAILDTSSMMAKLITQSPIFGTSTNPLARHPISNMILFLTQCLILLLR